MGVPFLMGRHDVENSHYRTMPDVVPIDCPHCGRGKVFTMPPYDEHRPTVWMCADCRGEFSVHRAPEAR